MECYVTFWNPEAQSWQLLHEKDGEAEAVGAFLGDNEYAKQGAKAFAAWVHAQEVGCEECRDRLLDDLREIRENVIALLKHRAPSEDDHETELAEEYRAGIEDGLTDIETLARRKGLDAVAAEIDRLRAEMLGDEEDKPACAESPDCPANEKPPFECADYKPSDSFNAGYAQAILDLEKRARENGVPALANEIGDMGGALIREAEEATTNEPPVDIKAAQADLVAHPGPGEPAEYR